jgi:hypothetical protein
VCSLLRTGVLLLGTLGEDVTSVSARTETGIPEGCGGRTYRLSGEDVLGGPADFDVCWLAGATTLRCDAAPGADTGPIPVGATEARITFFTGFFAQYELRAPV